MAKSSQLAAQVEGLLGSIRPEAGLTKSLGVTSPDQKKVERTLPESERRFRQMIDALPVAIYTTDAEGRLTHFNAAAVEFSGRTPELGSDQWCVTWKLYYPDGTPMPHDKCPMAIALKEGRILRDVEAIAERPDGKRIWFTPYPTPLRDPDGTITGGVNMLLDITERKQAEEARARLAAIVESSDDAIVSKDLNGIIMTWNKGAERLFGYTAQEAVGQSITMLIPPERSNEETGILERIRRGESVEHYETVRRRKDGALLDISLTISPVIDSNQKIIGASKIARDITQRKRMEDELARWRFTLESRVAEQTQQLQAEAAERKRLEAEVAGAAEAEQERLGQELHDGLGQELTGIAMMLDVLKMNLMKAAPKQATEAQRLEMMLRGSADKARQLAKGFYPVEVEKYGLQVALLELARRNQESFGVRCDVEAEGDIAGLHDGQVIQLYRIAQEALHNAVKHAKAKQILVRLSRQKAEWMLTVKDDGVGLPAGAPGSSGMGLRIMRYRAHMMDGRLSVRNDDVGGVIVSCWVPVIQKEPIEVVLSRPNRA